MTTSSHAACYGNMFPDLEKLTTNEPSKGAVFHVGYTSYGCGVSSRDSGADEVAFEKCQACPQYRACYDLSLGKFAAAIAIHTAV